MERALNLTVPLVWLQLDDGLATLAPRQAIRKASMENGLLSFIMQYEGTHVFLVPQDTPAFCTVTGRGHPFDRDG